MSSAIPDICKRLYERQLIAGIDGNVSEKKGDQIVITPSGVDKSEVLEKDLCLINLKGDILKGQPSSESPMHLSVYKYQSQAQAVVHAHPPSAIALSLARPDWKTLPQALPEIIVSLGQVPFVPYQSPGSRDLGESLKPFVKKSRALILSHHGAVVWGTSLKEACFLMEQLEHSCKILCASEAMGKTSLLSDKERERLFKLYK